MMRSNSPKAARSRAASLLLALHLIVAHHGGGRPTIRHGGEEERAGEVALRFARLQQRWGPWGLAWWEALLRAADAEASRRHDEGNG